MSGTKQYNALVINSSSEVKSLRSSLEKNGYYDSSRQIQRVSFPSPDKPVSECFAIPITSSCATHLKSSSPLPPPYTDCTLANMELPPSKRARAKLHQPYRTLREAVRRYLVEAGGGYSVEGIETLLLDVPRSWERHGDLVVLPENSFKDQRWQPHLHCSTDPSQTGLVCKEVFLNGAKEEDQQPALLEAVALALNCKRLAIDQSIICDSYRSSGARLLLGGDGWVDHLDNGVHYTFDVTKCMFSSGNISEKLRVAKLNCEGETVVDLYAGIGYFTLPYLVHSGAVLVHVCEWNPHAVEALERGLVANRVRHKCVIHHGDNREVAPVGVADRVNLGLVPSSEGGWPVACRALKNSTGGWMHVHGNVSSKHKSSKDGSLSVEQSEDGCSSSEYNPWEIKDTDKCSSSKSTNSASKGVDKQTHKAGCTQLKETRENCWSCELSQSDKMALRANQAPSSKQEVWERWAGYVAEEMLKMLEKENPQHPDSGRKWSVTVKHIEHVKSYAPHIDHLVVDLDCRPQEASSTAIHCSFYTSDRGLLTARRMSCEHLDSLKKTNTMTA